MDGADKKYIVDASSWITVENHPAQNRILFCVGKLIESGKILCPTEAWGEVKFCPWVLAWLEPDKDDFVQSISTTEYLMTVGRVTHRFPAMAGARRRKERADQYIVATAMYLNATSNPTKHIVICEETDNQRASRKLVTACDALGVEHKGLLEMLRDEFPEEGW